MGLRKHDEAQRACQNHNRHKLHLTGYSQGRDLVFRLHPVAVSDIDAFLNGMITRHIGIPGSSK